MNKDRKTSFAEKEKELDDKLKQVNSKEAQLYEAELTSRYFKAQYEIKYYTLEDDKISVPYSDLVKKIQETRAAAIKTIEASKELNQEVADAG